MAGLKPSQIRDLTRAEMQQRLQDSREELFNLRFQNATGQLDNYKRIKELRRDVARLMTVLREQELSEVESEERA